MTERSLTLAEFQSLLCYSGWEGLKLEELSIHLRDHIKDPSLNGMLVWA